MINEELNLTNPQIWQSSVQYEEIPSFYTPQSARRVVFKFGGTVCGKLPLEIVDICLNALRYGPIAIVCSARSGKTKAEGTTNLLLQAARQVCKLRPLEAEQAIETIYRQHEVALDLLSSGARSKALIALTDECNAVKQLLSKLGDLCQGRVFEEKDPGYLAKAHLEDQIMGCGERLSAFFLATLLEDHGTPTKYIDLSSILSNDDQDPSGVNENSVRQLSSTIKEEIMAGKAKVPVITGFFGVIKGGLLNDCRRGYSDVLSAIVAASVDAKELQIWKEVNGVYTADPTKVPTAKLIPSLHPQEALELTFFGSEVIHHRTLNFCMEHRTPIRIKNARDPDGQGTVILPDTGEKVKPMSFRRPQKPTAVTIKDHITVVNVHSHRKASSPEFLEQICKILRQHGLSVDLFELNETHVSLAVHSPYNFTTMFGKRDQEAMDESQRDLRSAIIKLQSLGVVEVHDDMVILSLIGKGLKHSYGIAGRFFSALGNNFINIEMISQGASEINISCVVRERDALRALSIVHTELFTFID